ncbi:MAG: IS4 family transposase [Bacteroidota bacterium]
MLGSGHLSGNALRRLEVLATMVSGVLHQGSSRLSDLARMNCDSKQQASKEKQLSRWIQSDHTSYSVHYLPYIVPLLESLSARGELVFSIDGSTGGQGCMILMFSVIYRNRAIPVVWHVVKAKKGHLPESAHRDLLKELAEIVPSDCQVSIVGDGEYDGCDWQKDIRALGWDYVLRTGVGRLIETEPGEQVKIGSMAPEKAQPFFMLYDLAFTQKRYGPVNLLIQHQKGYKDPIYLLSNLDFPPAISQLYKKRFKIETFFSDQKSRGFNIQRSKIGKPQRLAKLLIATCIAYIFCILAAVKAYQSKFYSMIHRSDRSDLSLFSIGFRFIELLVDIRQWRTFKLKLIHKKIDHTTHKLSNSVR